MRSDENTALAAPRHSLLFVPGNRPNWFSSALATNADCVCIDLEDSVPFDEKVSARQRTLEFVSKAPSARLAIRINRLASQCGIADLLAIAESPKHPALILIPKVHSVGELLIAIGAINDESVGLLPAIETAEGLTRASDIADAPQCVGVLFGGADLAADLGIPMMWEPLMVPRALLVYACARAGVPAIDVPFVDLHDTTGLEAEARRVKALGFLGKAAIHPHQIETINSVFRPTAEEILEANEALSAYAAAGGGAVQFRGKLLEEPIVRRYRRILMSVSTHKI